MGVSRVGRMSIDLETTAGITAAGAFTDLRICEPPDIKLGATRLEDTTLQDRLHDSAGWKDGQQQGTTVKFPIYGEGLATALDASATYTFPQTTVEKLLRGIMGGSIGGAGSDISGAASTTTAVNVTDGQGIRFNKAGALVTRHSSSQPFEMRSIKDVATGGNPDVLTLKHALHTAPTSAGTDVYNCVSYFLDEDNVGGDGDIFRLRYYGIDPNDQWTFPGCGATFKIETPNNGYLRFVIESQAMGWTGPSSGGTLAGASYTGSGGLVCKDMNLQFQTVGTTTRNCLIVDEITIDPGMTLVPETGITTAVVGPGINGVVRWRMLKARPKVKFSAHMYNTNGVAGFQDFYTHFATESTVKSVFLTIGTAPILAGVGTGMCGIEVPKCMYTAVPQITRGNGLIMIEAELEGIEDTDITSITSGTGATADLENSIFRIHQA